MKKVISCLLFCALIVGSLVSLNALLIPKADNRYYMIKQYLVDNPQQNMHDVQVYGSCHAYTSFNPLYLEERTGVSTYVYATPSEIIPTTYLRMVEQFKIHTPQVVLVETWGINPYETYITTSEILEYYLPSAIEAFPFSREKQEVIDDFDSLDGLSMHFPLIKYKDRLTDGSIALCDFDYSFENTKGITTEFIYDTMSSRFARNGFLNHWSDEVVDYPDKQVTIEDGAFTQIEPVIVKYLQKIIDLCKQNDVGLIFYRAPYVSTANELQKLNHLRQICDENDVLFIDLEAELKYNYAADFYDYEHLSEIGANRSTEFLAPYVLDTLEKQGVDCSPINKKSINLLRNNNLTAPANQSGQTVFSSAGKTIDSWYTDWEDFQISLTNEGVQMGNRTGPYGWAFYQLISLGEDEDFSGKSLTAEFQIEDSLGKNMRPAIYCYDENSKTLKRSYAQLENGKVYLSCVVPEGTKYIRVGFCSINDVFSYESVVVKSITLYEGAYTSATWPE